MKIAVVASVGHHIDTFFPRIIQRWRSCGHTVSVVTSNSPKSMDAVVLDELSRRPGVKTLSAIRSFRAWAAREEPDVVLTNTATASAVVRLANIQPPVVYFAHGLHWDNPRAAKTLPWRLAETGLARQTTAAISLNAPDTKWFRSRGVPVTQLEFGVGLDINHFRRGPFVPPSEPLRLCWIGEFSKRKRPMYAIRVMADLRARGIRATLEMAGEGALLPMVVEQIRQLELSSHVRVLGYTDPLPVINGSDALLHTSAWEGLPRVILEATAVGKPALSLPVKGVHGAPNVRTAAGVNVKDLADLVVGMDTAAYRDLYTMLPPLAELSDEIAADRIMTILTAAIDLSTARGV